MKTALAALTLLMTCGVALATSGPDEKRTGGTEKSAGEPAVTAPEEAARRDKIEPSAPLIEVCFVLDSTGSMGGLIDGAKAKIWSIANQMIAAKPTPRLRIGLLTYRDRGDEYVTKSFDLTDDIDTVYANLTSFQAGGGGDGPESVNQALHEAVTKMSWSSSRDVLKIIFLVGDFPPHMDYTDDVPYTDTCQAAMKKDLLINTIQCGDEATTTPVWQEIARLGEGKYVAIGQTGDMQVVSTPVDEKLTALNVEMGKTLLPYGSVAQRGAVASKQAASESAPAAVSADRLRYGASTGKAVHGAGDLVDDVRAGVVKLADLKAEELPEEMREMTPGEQAAFLEKRSAERGKIQEQINALLKQRQEFIDAELKKLAVAGKGSAFDTEVAQTIRAQAARKGIRYDAADPK